jgi:hypothetical protein
MPWYEFARHLIVAFVFGALVGAEGQWRQHTAGLFNTINHTQFYGSGSVDGNVDDATFGKVLKAAPPRVSQAALKSLF